MKVSIVIASHRKRMLPATLAAIEPQCRERSDREVIVVIDYPLGNLGTQFPWVKWKEVLDRSISRKRNVGIVAARGEIVGFTDDDCIPAPDWIDTAQRFLTEHHEYAGVEGCTRVPADPGNPGLSREFRRLEKPGFRTNNIFYRRDLLNKIGGFDQRFTVQREDLDLAFTIEDLGHRISYEPRQVVHHGVRSGEHWDLLKNCINRRFDPLLHKKHPARYRRVVGGPFPPGLKALLFLEVLSLVCVPLGLLALMVLGGSSLVGAAFLGFRRGRGTTWPGLLREIGSFLLAPMVLLGALIYGSFRFRTLLIL